MEGPLKRVLDDRRESCIVTLDTAARTLTVRPSVAESPPPSASVTLSLGPTTCVTRPDDATPDDFSFTISGITLVAHSEESLHSWLELLDDVLAAVGSPGLSPRPPLKPPPPPQQQQQQPTPPPPLTPPSSAEQRRHHKRKTAARSVEAQSVIVRQSRPISATDISVLDDYLCGLVPGGPETLLPGSEGVELSDDVEPPPLPTPSPAAAFAAAIVLPPVSPLPAKPMHKPPEKPLPSVVPPIPSTPPPPVRKEQRSPVAADQPPSAPPADAVDPLPVPPKRQVPASPPPPPPQQPPKVDTPPFPGEPLPLAGKKSSSQSTLSKSCDGPPRPPTTEKPARPAKKKSETELPPPQQNADIPPQMVQQPPPQNRSQPSPSVPERPRKQADEKKTFQTLPASFRTSQQPSTWVAGSESAAAAHQATPLGASVITPTAQRHFGFHRKGTAPPAVLPAQSAPAPPAKQQSWQATPKKASAGERARMLFARAFPGRERSAAAAAAATTARAVQPPAEPVGLPAEIGAPPTQPDPPSPQPATSSSAWQAADKRKAHFVGNRGILMGSAPEIAEGVFSRPLPMAAVLMIFADLSPQELGLAGRVCKKWRAIAKTPSLWVTFCYTLGLAIPSNCPPDEPNPYRVAVIQFRREMQRTKQNIYEGLYRAMLLSPPKVNQGCGYCGWACKRGEDLLKVWKRRWFVIWNNCLCYFRSRKPDELTCGVIPLTADVRAHRIKRTWLKLSSEKGVIVSLKIKEGAIVQSGRGDVFISTETEADCNLWISTVRANAAVSGQLLSFKKPEAPRFRIFGVPIESLMEQQRATDQGACPIPRFLRQIFDVLEEPRVLAEEGLFRLSGSVDAIAEIKSTLEQGADIDFHSKDPHALTAVVKLFFRELPVLLIPAEINFWTNKVLAATDFARGGAVPQEVLVEIRECLKGLPSGHFELFKALITLFKKVAANSAVNRMTQNNIFIVVIPTIRCAPSLLALAMEYPTVLF